MASPELRTHSGERWSITLRTADGLRGRLAAVVEGTNVRLEVAQVGISGGTTTHELLTPKEAREFARDLAAASVAAEGN